MQQLQFAELDDHGRLVLEDEAGTRYAVPVDDRLRAALRPRRAPAGPDRAEPSATPREVQAMIRAGQTAEEVASATGWELARVQRFEGPVLAEREHVVGLAKAAHVRAQGRTDGSHTLDRRVRERLQSRGVTPEGVTWDAARSEAHGPWTVLVAFDAGGRERRAAWHYDVQDRSIEALDDEARWLSEDEQALPGGLAGHPLLGTSTAEDESNDLMATMRARRQRRQRRTTTRKSSGEAASETTTDDASPTAEDPDPAKPAGRGARAKKAATSTAGQLVDEVLPLEDFDEATLGTPPAAHPRGSAAESPSPIAAVALEEDPGPVVDVETVEDVDAVEVEVEVEEPDGRYARTRHDPYEVSFDEFFGTDDEDDDDEDDDELEEELELEEEQVEAADAFEDPDVLPDQHHQDHGDEPTDVSASGEVDEIDGDEDVPDEDDPAEAGPADQNPAEEATTEQGPAVEETSRRKGRASVPSWDDIMFGSGSRKR